MKDRIEINGVWYVREDTQLDEKDLDITNYLGCDAHFKTFNISSFILIDEDENIMKDTFFMEITKGDHKEQWDNDNWIRDFPRSIGSNEQELLKIFTDSERIDIKKFIDIIKVKGWI